MPSIRFSNKKVDEKDILKSGEFVYHKTEKGKIREFFDHLVAYGGISFNEGVLRIWGDPSLFTPAEAFVVYYNELRKSINKEADDLFHWLGRLYGKNSSLMLIKKFGFDKKNVADFVSGATQDGFGFMEVLELKYSENSFYGEVEGTNSTFSMKYLEKFGSQKSPIDFYIGGVLGGGSEPIFNFPIETYEEECMVQGKKSCKYILKSVKQVKPPRFFEKINLNEEELQKKTGIMGRKRNVSFSVLNKPDIKFGNGNFILRGYMGFNLASYEHVLLDKISFLLLGEKKFFDLKEKLARIYIDNTFDERLVSSQLNNENVRKLLNHLEIFGFGKLETYYFQKNKLIIKNLRNPYLEDSFSLFGKIDKLGLDMLIRILKNAFEKYFNKKVKVRELKSNVKLSSIEITFL